MSTAEPQQTMKNTPSASTDAGDIDQPDLLRTIADNAASYLADLISRGVRPDPRAVENLDVFDEPLADQAHRRVGLQKG